MSEKTSDPRPVVLIVDDEPEIRKLLRIELETTGFRALEAPNGREASRLCQEEKLDLVITDLAMPEQEGIETIRQMRRLAPEVPVIAISGAFYGQVLEAARLLGAAEVFMKPLDFAKLMQTVHRLALRRPAM